MTPRNHGAFFLAQYCVILSHYLIIQKLDSQFLLLYENIPLAEMLSGLKEAKKLVHIYRFHGKHFTCWDLCGTLEADNFA